MQTTSSAFSNAPNTFHHPTREFGPHHYDKATVTLNNVGSDLIECGDYVGSIEFLSAAFQHSRKEIDEILTTNSSAANNATNMKYLPSACAVDVWMMRDIAVDSSRQSQGDVVYTHPIHVPSRASDPSAISVAVAITFNLAIAYHLASLQCTNNMTFQGNSKEHLMRQALRLYQYTFRLQRTQARSSQSPFFFMACINNIGILFRELGEHHHSEECFNHLLSLLMYMNTVEDPTVASHNNNSRFEFFFLNTTRLAYKSCSICAAAA